jgi:hypothetical protein
MAIKALEILYLILISKPLQTCYNVVEFGQGLGNVKINTVTSSRSEWTNE